MDNNFNSKILKVKVQKCVMMMYVYDVVKVSDNKRMLADIVKY